MAPNTLYYGDNLDVLRRHIPDESVDLVYLDPPFKSNATYNVLFGDQQGVQSAAQIKAFEDTWHWDTSAAEAFDDVLQYGGRPAEAMRAFETLLGHNDMLAYLAMMAPRLIELRRVLKPTGSIYLHCDPTASHYLKVVMDAVFGPGSFRNEIAWRRTPFKGSSKARAQQYPRSHDVVLFYSRGAAWTWSAPTTPYSEDYLKRFRHDDGDGRGPYRKTLLKTFSEATFERLKTDGRLVAPVRPGAMWSYKQYLSESSGGVQIDDMWLDVNAINPVAAERLGYPTQKPEALLERIISASSNPGDLVLDPFCGCGTAVVAAQRLGRRWIGIDVTHLAVNLMRTRLRDTFGDAVEFNVVGEPTSVQDAEELARTDPYQFQFWALGLVGARPHEEKKGADKGIDGRLYFRDEPKAPAKQVIISVKAGNLHRNQVHELEGVVKREGAEIAVLITMNAPTRPMREEAASAGFYDSSWGTRHPRVQLLTVGELLAGKGIDYPAPRLLNVTFKQAPRAGKKVAESQGEMFNETG